MKNEIWAMPKEHVEELLDRIESLRATFNSGVDMMATQKAALEQLAELKPYSVKDGVARVKVSGPIMKSVPWFVGALGIEATGSEQTAEVIRTLAADEDVEQIVLDIDSPGGQVAGLHNLVDAVREAKDAKPVKAYASDLAASAAYWIGSQATEFSASRGAAIGSIGVYSAIPDLSEAFAAEGIKVHVFSSGKFKGAAVEGAPLTDDAKKMFQSEVDELAETFTAEVAEGRGLDVEAVEKLATGRTWLGIAAAKRELIDRVETRKQFESRLQQTKAPAEGAENKEQEDMENVKELEALKAELEALKAEKEKEAALREAAQATLAAQKDAQKKEMLDAAVKDGRVPPSAIASYERVAAVSEPEEFKMALDGLPKVVRTEAEGVGDCIGKPAQKQIPSHLKLIGVTADDIDFAEANDSISILGGIE